jgi:hypothetical protein
MTAEVAPVATESSCRNLIGIIRFERVFVEHVRDRRVEALRLVRPHAIDAGWQVDAVSLEPLRVHSSSCGHRFGNGNGESVEVGSHVMVWLGGADNAPLVPMVESSS